MQEDRATPVITLTKIKKRTAVCLGVLMVILAASFFSWGGKPKFVPAGKMEPIGAYKELVYDARNPAPFPEGRIWLNTKGGTNSPRWFLCSLEKRKLLGELLHADPLFIKGERLLCVQRPKSHGVSTLAVLLYRFSNGHIRVGRPTVDQFWIVNLQDGSRKKVGECPTSYPSTTTFVPSPDFRYAYNNTMAYPFFLTYLLDMDAERIWWGKVEPSQSGKVEPSQSLWQGYAWWSAKELIVRDTDGQYLLYDMVSGKTSLFLSTNNMSIAFRAAGIEGSPLGHGGMLRPVWNGQEYDIQLESAANHIALNGSYLFKIERPGRNLALLSTNFRFYFYADWKPDQTQYVYAHDGFWGSAVFLHDMRTGTNRTILERQPGTEYSSLPNFYNDGVVYVRDLGLWWMDLNGSNRVQIFPPLE